MKRGGFARHACTWLPVCLRRLSLTKVNLGEAFGDRTVQLFQELAKLLLPFPFGGRSLDLARARSESGEKIQRSFAFVLRFHANRHRGLSRQRRRWARSRWQARFLVHAQHPFGRCQFPRGQRATILNASAKRSSARHRGRQPQGLAPGLARVAGPKPRPRWRRDRRDHAVGNQLSRPFRTIPVRQRPAHVSRPRAGDLDERNRDFGGKRQAVGRCVSHRKVRPRLGAGTGWPTGTEGGAASERCGRWPKPRFRPPRAEGPAPAWPPQRQRLAAAPGRRSLHADRRLPTRFVGALPVEHPCSQEPDYRLLGFEIIHCSPF